MAFDDSIYRAYKHNKREENHGSNTRVLYIKSVKSARIERDERVASRTTLAGFPPPPLPREEGKHRTIFTCVRLSHDKKLSKLRPHRSQSRFRRSSSSRPTNLLTFRRRRRRIEDATLSVARSARLKSPHLDAQSWNTKISIHGISKTFRRVNLSENELSSKKSRHGRGEIFFSKKEKRRERWETRPS